MITGPTYLQVNNDCNEMMTKSFPSCKEILGKGSVRAYSLGIIIVANTVGSQQAVTRILGFEINAAGF